MGGCGRRTGGEQEGVDLLGRVPMDEGVQVALLSLLIHQGPALCTTILHLFIIFLQSEPSLQRIMDGKENISRNCFKAGKGTHPSQQSSQPTYKPCIRIGYPQTPSPAYEERRAKKAVAVQHPVSKESRGVKRGFLNSQHASSRVLADEAEKGSIEQLRRPLRKGVDLAQRKYYGGEQVQQELRQQFMVVRSKSAFLSKGSEGPGEAKVTSRVSKASDVVPCLSGIKWERDFPRKSQHLR